MSSEFLRLMAKQYTREAKQAESGGQTALAGSLRRAATLLEAAAVEMEEELSTLEGKGKEPRT